MHQLLVTFSFLNELKAVMNHVSDSNRPFLLLKAFPIDAKHQLVGSCYISMSTVLVNVNQPANGMSLWSQMK